jgi:sugar phosphate isomerase/epimerase
MSTEDHATTGMGRRQFLTILAAGTGVAVWDGLAGAGEPAVRSQMGLASDCWHLNHRAQVAQGQKGDLSDPRLFLERCYRLGAGGMQVPLGVRDEPYCAGLRGWAETHGMYIEGSASLADNRFDPERFEQEVLTARSAGATVVRTVVMPGRRYEQFNSADEYARSARRAAERLQQAEPIVARHRIRLAVENHKGHRVEERLALLRQLSSEWIGMCVDTGNSFALCEDPLEVVRAYAPFACSVHVRDHAVREYEEGFLFGETALGQGFFDVPAMIGILREARPEVRFNLEVIARDPLQVPILTPKYWATMADVPATDLARTLRIVRSNTPPGPLPTVSSLSREQQARCEQRMVQDSLAFAREHLGL